MLLNWDDGSTDLQEPLSFVLGVTAVDQAGNMGSEATLHVFDPGRAAAIPERTGLCGSVLPLFLLPVLGRRRRMNRERVHVPHVGPRG